MTSVALLGALLAAGWLFYRQWRFTRFEALHNPGHPQYFGAALCAVYLLALASPSHALASRLDGYMETVAALSQLFPLEASQHQSRASIVQHMVITAWTLGLATVVPLFLNSPLVEGRRLAQVIARRHGAIDHLEELAIKCEEEGMLCGLTLENGKFYVGLLEEFSGPRIGKEWVALTPIASGYRSETGQLELTTFYDVALSTAHISDPFRIVVSIKQIVSAQSFDLVLYQEFRRPRILLPSGEPAAVESVGDADAEPAGAIAHDRWPYYLYLGFPLLLLLAPYAGLESALAGASALLIAALFAVAAQVLTLDLSRLRNSQDR